MGEQQHAWGSMGWMETLGRLGGRACGSGLPTPAGFEGARELDQWASSGVCRESH